MNQLKQTITWLMLSLCLILSTNLSAQEKELFVKYKLTDHSVLAGVHLEVLSKGPKTLSTLVRKLTISGVRYTRVNGSLQKTEAGEDEEVTQLFHTFKDASNDLLISCDDLDDNTIIKESLDLFKWQLTNKRDTILGYPCQQAKTHFRGRDYTLWFTTELPFKTAPWKFHGLPGVVLKAESDDNFYKAEAMELKVRNPKREIKNPYKGKSTLSWEEHKKRYIKIHKESVAKNKAVNARLGIPESSVVVGASKKEVIVERNRYTIDQMFEMKNKDKK